MDMARAVRIVCTLGILTATAVAVVCAGELRHKDIGQQMTKAEWEAIDTHFILDGEEGDLLYGTAAGPITRLPLGTAGEVLVVATGTPGIPAWESLAVIAPTPTPQPTPVLYWAEHLSGELRPATPTPLATGTPVPYDVTVVGDFVAQSGASFLSLLHHNGIQSSGGDARGTVAVDLQTVRSNASEVASGYASVLSGGSANTASGPQSAVAGGISNVAGGAYSFVAGGYQNNADGDYSFAAGRRAKATGTGSMAFSDTTDEDFTVSTNNALGLRFAGGVSTSADLSVGGDLTVDGTTLVVDSESNKVGVGTASPATALHVIGSVRAVGGVSSRPATGPASLSATTISAPDGGSVASLSLSSYTGTLTNAAPEINLSTWRGSGAAATATQDNDYLGTIYFMGAWEAASSNVSARIRGYQDGVVTGVQVPGRLEFSTNDGTAGVAARLTIQGDGDVVVAENLSVGGNLTATGGIDSTVIGGTTAAAADFTTVDTSGALSVGGAATVTGNLAVDTNVLFVNASTNRVGIGTATPSAALDVVGAIDVGEIERALISTYFPSGSSGDNIWIGGGGQKASYASVATDARQNTALGVDASRESTTGYQNTAVGYRALLANTTGFNNVAIGRDTMVNNSGSSNMGIGSGAMSVNSGNENVAIGSLALLSQTTGSNNVAIGYVAGRVGASSTYVLTDTDLVLIGDRASKSATTEITNAIAIGSGALVSKSHQVVLGNTSIVETVLRGSVYAAGVYAANVGSTYRDVVALADGQLGYDGCSLDYKENVVDVPTTDVDKIRALQPRKYDRKDGSATGEIGLIAEEVAAVYPDAVSYRQDVTEVLVSDAVTTQVLTVVAGDDGTTSTVWTERELHPARYEKVYTMTTEPETVVKSRLIVPILAVVQEQQATIEALTAALAALEARVAKLEDAAVAK